MHSYSPFPDKNIVISEIIGNDHLQANWVLITKNDCFRDHYLVGHITIIHMLNLEVPWIMLQGLLSSIDTYTYTTLKPICLKFQVTIDNQSPFNRILFLLELYDIIKADISLMQIEVIYWFISQLLYSRMTTPKMEHLTIVYNSKHLFVSIYIIPAILQLIILHLCKIILLHINITRTDTTSHQSHDSFCLVVRFSIIIS